jgi:hypothetical protein
MAASGSNVKFMENITCGPSNFRSAPESGVGFSSEPLEDLLLMDQNLFLATSAPGPGAGPDSAGFLATITSTYCRNPQANRAADANGAEWCFAIEEDTDSNIHDGNARNSKSSGAGATFSPPDKLKACDNAEDCENICRDCAGCNAFYYTENNNAWNKCQFLKIPSAYMNSNTSVVWTSSNVLVPTTANTLWTGTPPGGLTDPTLNYIYEAKVMRVCYFD